MPPESNQPTRFTDIRPQFLGLPVSHRGTLTNPYCLSVIVAPLPHEPLLPVSHRGTLTNLYCLSVIVAPLPHEQPFLTP